jgi:hypothetical protein
MCSAPMSASARPRRASLPTVCLLLLCLCCPAAGAGESILIATPVTSGLSVEPRQTVTFAVIVSNLSETTRNLGMTVVAPGGMKVIAVEGDFRVGGGDSVVRVAGVNVPSHVLAGAYAVACRFEDRDDPAIVAQCEVVLRILPKPTIEVEVLESPSLVIAGQSCTATFSVRNAGNVNVRFDLSVLSSIGLPVEVQGIERLDDRELAPGARDVVTLAVKTDPDIRTSTLHHLQVLARFHEGQAGVGTGSDTVADVATATTEIVPLAFGGISPMHTIGAHLDTKGTVTVDGNAWGEVVETFTAAGSLDDAGEHQIDVLVRKGLASDQAEVFSAPDTFSLGYRQDLGELHLGEFTHTISPLLAKDRLGIGVHGLLDLDPLEVGVLYANDAWTSIGSSTLAGVGRWKIPREHAGFETLYDVQLSTLTNLADHTSFDLWQRFNPFPGLATQLDAAVQIGAGTAFVPAILASVEGSQKSVSFSTRFVRAWAGFEGEYSDLCSFSVNATVGPLFENLTINAGFSLADANPDLDPFLPSADRATKTVLHASGTIPVWGTRLSSGWELERHDDRLLSAYDTWQNTITLKAQQDAGAARFGVSSSFKFLTDVVSGSSSFKQNHSLDFAYALLESVTKLSASIEYEGAWSDAASGTQSVEISLAAHGTSEKTKWSLGAGNEYQVGGTRLLRVSVDLSGAFQHSFRWNHTLSAQGGLGVSTDLLTWSPSIGLNMSYGIPLDIPVSRKKGTAIVQGTVFNRETGAKLPGVLLRLDGLAAVTNGEGGFTFNVPHAGTYSIRIEGGSAAAGLIAAEPELLRLELAPHSERTVDVAMTSGATVRGTVNLYRPSSDGGLLASVDSPGNVQSPDATELVKARGVGNVLLEMADGTTRRRRLTNGNGDFLFEQMVPGTYTLRVVDALLPSYTRFEQDAFRLELAPGDERVLELRVVPEQRHVKILPGVTTLVLQGLPEVKPGSSVSTGQPVISTTTTTTDTTTSLAAVPESVTTPAPEGTTIAPAGLPASGVPQAQPAEAMAVTPAPPAAVELPGSPAPPVPAVTAELPAAPGTPPFRTVPPAAPAELDEPAPTWDEIVAAWRDLPFLQVEPPFKAIDEVEAAAPAGTAPVTLPTAVPAPTVPATPPPVTPAVPAPVAPTAPVANPVPPTPPVAPPAIPAPAPTPPPITIPLPLPMPTPRPPVIVPVPSPTPQPFPP